MVVSLLHGCCTVAVRYLYGYCVVIVWTSNLVNTIIMQPPCTVAVLSAIPVKLHGSMDIHSYKHNYCVTSLQWLTILHGV